MIKYLIKIYSFTIYTRCRQMGAYSTKGVKGKTIITKMFYLLLKRLHGYRLRSPVYFLVILSLFAIPSVFLAGICP